MANSIETVSCVIVSRLSAEMMGFLLQGAEPALHPLEESVREYPEEGVQRHRNLTYLDGHPRDSLRRKLDLFVPADPARRLAHRPLIMFVHGGGWRMGSKDDLMGLYGRIGRHIAASGIAFAAINYRLTPRVSHPGHIEDVAAALAWLRANADRYGFRNDQIFVAGHSAGAHLASLLALNGRFLARHRLDPRDCIPGVIALSGLFDLRDLESFLPVELEGAATLYGLPEHPVARAGLAFPPETVEDASPIVHITYDAPPFLVIHESHGEFMKRESITFAEALDRASVPYQIIEMPDTNHISMLIELIREPDHPAMRAVVQFASRSGLS